MLKTQVRSSRDLRNHYREVVDSLKNHDHVIITHQGRGEVVLINFDDFAGYEEYLYDKHVQNELAKTEKRIQDSDATWHSHEEAMSVLKGN